MPLHPEIEQIALLNWAVYPCSRHSKAGCFKGAQAAATCDLNQLVRWSNEFPNCNWRVVFGKSRLWGLDLDIPSESHPRSENGITALANMVAVHGPIPPRPQARSGGGGLGLYFSWTGERISGESGYPVSGVDPKRGALSQTIPPSIHILTKRPYRWLIPPWDIAPPVAPAWLSKWVSVPPQPPYKPVQIDTTEQARRRLYRAAMAVMDAPPGNRNDTLNRRAYQAGRLIGAGLLDEREAVDALYGAARTAGLDHGEARETIRSGIKSGVARAG